MYRWYGVTTRYRRTGKQFGSAAATWKSLTPTLCEFAATPLAMILLDPSTPTSTPWRDSSRTWSAAAARRWNSNDDRPTTCSTFWWSESTRLRDWTPSADSTPPDSFSSNNFTWVSFCWLYTLGPKAYSIKPSFSPNLSHCSLSSSSSGLTIWIPRTFTVASEQIRFYFVVFLYYTF